MIALTYSRAQILCHGEWKMSLLSTVSVWTCPCWREERLTFYGIKKKLEGICIEGKGYNYANHIQGWKGSSFFF